MPFITRPPVEIYGRHSGYGFAGLSVNTAIGNFTQVAVDLQFPSGLLGLLDWKRTYNSHSGAIGALGPGWLTSLSARLVPSTGGMLHHSAGPVTFNDEDGRVLTFTPAEGGGYTRPQDLNADLTQNTDGSFTLTYNSGLVWSFDSAGRLTGRSLGGQAVTLNYGSDDLLLRADHSPSGTRLEFTYDASRRLTAVASSDGRTLSFAYSAGDATSEVLQRATGSGGGVTSFEWAGSGEAAQVTRITDPDGNLLVANTYDAATRQVTAQAFPLGGGAAFDYGDTGLTTVTTTPGDTRMTFQAAPSGRLVTATDSAGNASRFSYDDNGRMTETVRPGGTSRGYTYDSRGNLLSSTFGGTTTSWTYDDSNRLTSTTDAVGGRTGFSYETGSRVPSVVTDPVGNATRLTSAGGLVTARTDADGNTTRFGYDGSGRVVSVTNALGEITTHAYDAVGNRIETVLPNGDTTRFTYDGNGRVTSQTDSGGAVTSYQYSPAGRLTQITDATGAATSYAYDEAGNRVTITDALGRRRTSAYDALGNLTSATDPVGETTTYSWDGTGRLSTVADPLRATTRFSYDPDGNKTERQGPDGTTLTSYDTRGNPVTITDPVQAVTRIGYDDNDRVVSRTDPDQNTWQTGYDATGNVVTMTDPLNSVTRQRWTPAGRLAASTDALGHETTYRYDAAGRMTTVTGPAGDVVSYRYDQNGRRISETTPAGLETQYRYDTAGRLSATVDPRGWITRYEYDARGDKVAEISPSGAVTRWRYDAARQLTETIDSNGSVTRYGYDEAGRLITVTDPKDAVTRFAYDAAGRQISVTDPLGRETRYSYDAAGNLATITDPSGHTENMTYDADRRLLTKSAEDAAEVSFSYDAVGHRTTMTDATGTTRYGYDPAGRLTTVTDPDGEVLSMGYDAAGQRTSLSYPGGLNVGFSYDLNGRLIGMQDSRAGSAVYALDPDGRLLTEQLPGRFARRYHYQDGLLHRFDVIRDDHPVAQTSLTYDPDNRIDTQRDDEEPVIRYRYDPAGQLVSVLREGRPERHYGYDVAGNRVSQRDGETETRYRYDAADQLLGLEHRGRRVEFRYDSLGRLTEEVDGEYRRTISYDGFGMPVEVRRVVGREWSERIRAVFNGDGLLSSMVLTNENERRDEERAASVRYRWSTDDPAQILSQRAAPSLDDAERDRPRRLSADFAYGYGRTFASWADGAAAFHRDAFGSAVRTDEAAEWVQADGYGSFGEPEGGQRERTGGGARRDAAGYWRRVPRPPELPRFGYRGELALGDMLYLRARAYDTLLGRFTTRDPVTFPAGQSGTAAGNNPYAYVGNNPLNLTDPSGEFHIPGLSTVEHIASAGWHDVTRGADDVGNAFLSGVRDVRSDVVPILDTIRHDAAHYADVVIREIVTHPLVDIIVGLGALVAVVLAPVIIAAVLEFLAALGEVLLDVLLIAAEVIIELAIEALIIAGLHFLIQQIKKLFSPTQTQTVTPEALYAFGSKNSPRPPRIIDPDHPERKPDFPVRSRADEVGPYTPRSPRDNVPGASTFIDPKRAPVSGWYHRLPPGTPLLGGIALHADGEDVGGTQPWGHRTIYPAVRMTVNRFDDLFLPRTKDRPEGLPWELHVDKK